MLSVTLLLAKIAPVFCLMGLGFGLRRGRVLTREADQSLMRVVVNVLYPALILRFVLGNPALDDPRQLWLAPAVGFGTIVLGFGLAWMAAKALRGGHPRERGTFAFTTGIYNYGYIAIPVVLALPGIDNDATVGVLLIHNVGIEVAIWTVGIALLTTGSKRSLWSRVINAPVVTLLVALSLNLLGLDTHLPGFVTESILWLSQCAIPIGLVLAGATLADLLREERALSLLRAPRAGVVAALLRLGLLPLAFLLLARYLPGLTPELRIVLVVQAAMPAGIFPLVVSRHFEGDTRTAVQVVLGTTLLGLITIPLWIAFGTAWVL
ncbi:MAG: AEC family transporter [Opitutales bacterium]